MNKTENGKWLYNNQKHVDALLCLETCQIQKIGQIMSDSIDLYRLFCAYPYIYKYFVMHEKTFELIFEKMEEAFGNKAFDQKEVETSIEAVLNRLEIMISYSAYPENYDLMPFQIEKNWILENIPLADKVVLDIGAGTGHLSFLAAEIAKTVYAVEPLSSMRRYMRGKIAKKQCQNVYVVDGYLQSIPFPPDFFDIALAGNVFGGDPYWDFAELKRVLKSNGIILLVGLINNYDRQLHKILCEIGFVQIEVAHADRPYYTWINKKE